MKKIAAVLGNSSTYLTDYYYQSTGWRVAAFGGNADYGAYAGAWCWGLHRDSGYAYQFIGARLAF